MLAYAPVGFMWLIWAAVGAVILITLIVITALVVARTIDKSNAARDSAWCRKCGRSLRGMPRPLESARCPGCDADLGQPYAIKRPGE